MCGRRSLQSTQAHAKRRRSVRVASISMPRVVSAFSPSLISAGSEPAPLSLRRNTKGCDKTPYAPSHWIEDMRVSIVGTELPGLYELTHNACR